MHLSKMVREVKGPIMIEKNRDRDGGPYQIFVISRKTLDLKRVSHGFGGGLQFVPLLSCIINGSLQGRTTIVT